MARPPSPVTATTVRSVAPAWRPGRRQGLPIVERPCETRYVWGSYDPPDLPDQEACGAGVDRQDRVAGVRSRRRPKSRAGDNPSWEWSNEGSESRQACRKRTRASASRRAPVRFARERIEGVGDIPDQVPARARMTARQRRTPPRKGRALHIERADRLGRVEPMPTGDRPPGPTRRRGGHPPSRYTWHEERVSSGTRPFALGVTATGIRVASSQRSRLGRLATGSQSDADDGQRFPASEIRRAARSMSAGVGPFTGRGDLSTL